MFDVSRFIYPVGKASAVFSILRNALSPSGLFVENSERVGESEARPEAVGREDGSAAGEGLGSSTDFAAAALCYEARHPGDRE